jgi:hypothetical protein
MHPQQPYVRSAARHRHSFRQRPAPGPDRAREQVIFQHFRIDVKQLRQQCGGLVRKEDFKHELASLKAATIGAPEH